VSSDFFFAPVNRSTRQDLACHGWAGNQAPQNGHEQRGRFHSYSFITKWRKRPANCADFVRCWFARLEELLRSKTRSATPPPKGKRKSGPNGPAGNPGRDPSSDAMLQRPSRSVHHYRDAGAIFLVHPPHGFDIGKGCFEYALTQLLVALAPLLTGPGAYLAGTLVTSHASESIGRPVTRSAAPPSVKPGWLAGRGRRWPAERRASIQLAPLQTRSDPECQCRTA
jgi:hypothetical protein